MGGSRLNGTTFVLDPNTLPASGTLNIQPLPASQQQTGTTEGMPLDWTTNLWPASWGTRRTVDVDGYGETALNTWGSNYWMLDVDMDCSKTVNGWFELKSFITSGPGWEADVLQSGAPYVSGNHFAQCGKKNVFVRGSASADITALP